MMEVTNTAQSEREHARDTAGREGDHPCLGLQVPGYNFRVFMTSSRICPPKPIDRVQS